MLQFQDLLRLVHVVAFLQPCFCFLGGFFAARSVGVLALRVFFLLRSRALAWVNDFVPSALRRGHVTCE